MQSPDVPLFVYPCFMKCGKQYFCVKYNKMKMNKKLQSPQLSPKQSWYVDSCIAQFRREPVPSFRKTFKSHIIQRRFLKDSSVFSRWIPDDRKTLKLCLEHDLKWWKAGRFVKSDEDMKKLVNLIRIHYPVLKANFLWAASGSNFPTIDIGEFTDFSKKLQLPDKNVP